MKKQFFFYILSTFCGIFSVQGEEVYVRTARGEELAIEIDPNLSYLAVIEQVECTVAEKTGEVPKRSLRSYIWDYMEDVSICRSFKGPRNYNQEISSDEKRNIEIIVTSLAKNSYFDLIRNKSRLDRAGEKIDHVHPLRFLMCCFTSEVLKAGFHAIRDNGGKIWKEFFDEGLAKSLEEESKKDNIRPEHIQHFSSTLGINPNAVTDLIQKRRWSDFVGKLTELLPRAGNTSRYNQ